MNYPTNWMMQVENRSQDLFEVASFISNHTSAEVRLLVEDNIHSIVTLDGYIKNIISNRYNDFSLASSKIEVVLSNNPAYSIVGVYKDCIYGKQKIMQICTIRDSCAYIIEYIADPTEFDDGYH